MRPMILPLCAFLVLAPYSAFADWQYTSWGMTVEQVVEASKGTATPYRDEEPTTDVMKKDQEKSLYETRLRAPYKSGSIPLQARFGFRKDNGTLAYVWLSQVAGTDCATLYVALNKKYAEPVSTEKLQFMEVSSWHDKANNNRITWMLTRGDQCFVQYEPLNDADTSGL